LDALVFTGGVGENSWHIRQSVCAQLCWLGADLDRAANEAGETFVQSPASCLRILIIPADEEVIIAREALEILSVS